jgi:hypothetical protein
MIYSSLSSYLVSKHREKWTCHSVAQASPATSAGRRSGRGGRSDENCISEEAVHRIGLDQRQCLVMDPYLLERSSWEYSLDLALSVSSWEGTDTSYGDCGRIKDR